MTAVGRHIADARGRDGAGNGESTLMPNTNTQPDSQPTADNEAEQERPLFVVCVDHLERALEEYVDEHLRAPDVYLTSDRAAEAATGGRPIASTCQFCGEGAKYLVI